MSETPPLHPEDDEVLDIEYVPYDADPRIRDEIQKRTQGGRALSFLISEWRDAVMAAAEHPGDADRSERTAAAMNAVEDILEVLGIQRTEQKPPAAE